jgi:nucleoside-diphosphate-sugar epimerase
VLTRYLPVPDAAGQPVTQVAIEARALVPQSVRSIRGADNGFTLAEMFLLVTEGTGYVGSHAVAALTKAGHRVRILARSPGRVTAALAPLGVSGVESIGEVTDPVVVEGALDRSEAVLHAASVFSMDPPRADEMRTVNIRGTDTVLGTAHRLGLDPIVHVSSELALLPPAKGQVLADTISWLIEVGTSTAANRPKQ